MEDKPNAVRAAIGKIGSTTEVVRVLWDRFGRRVSPATIQRAVKAGRIGDSELLFSIATLTGASPWELAGKDLPQPAPSPEGKARRRPQRTGVDFQK